MSYPSVEEFKKFYYNNTPPDFQVKIDECMHNNQRFMALLVLEHKSKQGKHISIDIGNDYVYRHEIYFVMSFLHRDVYLNEDFSLQNYEILEVAFSIL